jgi:putrescine transport system ATP-binding protein
MELRVSRTNAARHQDTQLSRDQKVFAWWDGADIVVLTQ